MSWYCAIARRRIGINQNDAFNLYIAYVEGIGGYIRNTYKNKRWLIDVAHKVQSRAWFYRQQLTQCAVPWKKEKAWYKLF